MDTKSDRTLNRAEYENWMKELDSAAMRRHLAELCRYEKLSGGPDALLAARYIEKELKEAEIDCRIYTFPAYLSNPVESILTVCGADGGSAMEAVVYESRPRSFSGSCENLEAELIFDEHTAFGGTEAEKEAFYKTVRGKIVVGYGYDELYGKLLEDYGAAGWIQVWRSGEPLIHEDTVGAVWGTPDLDSRFLLFYMPVVGVTLGTGYKLIEKIRNAKNPVRARLTVRMDCGVREVALPVAEIQGASKEFVLLSCHYDTWYEGAFDNCAANAAVLEIARVLKRHEDKLVRSVRVAWWPGHSNGRYMGSAWYCDHFFRELRRHCIACLNSDLIGVSGVDMMGVKTTGTEGEAFLKRLLAVAALWTELAVQMIGRGADQSFFGADIPYHINPRLEAKEKPFATPGPGNDFWHTKEDTFDKLDFTNLKKDGSFLGLLTAAFAAEERLPLDVKGYFALWLSRFRKMKQEAAEEHVLDDVEEAILQTEEAVTKALEACAGEKEYEKVVKRAFGTLNRLFQMSGSPYEQDTAFAYGAFHLLGKSARVKRAEVSKELWLFSHTTFVRQKNRMLTELEELNDYLCRVSMRKEWRDYEG